MYFYSIRMLRSQPLRLALTVGGIALCAVLMLFLLGVYRGVSYGSVEYIRCNRADLWVLERNQTNILRCSSILQGDHGATIVVTETEPAHRAKCHDDGKHGGNYRR